VDGTDDFGHSPVGGSRVLKPNLVHEVLLSASDVCLAFNRAMRVSQAPLLAEARRPPLGDGL